MRDTALLRTALIALAGCSAIIEPPLEIDPPPVITITSPVAGTPVSRTVTVTGAASSPAGVASVRFELPDGTSTTDSVPPYSVSWDSTTVADGSYPIQAIATDAQGATSVAQVAIDVANRPCLATVNADDLPLWIPDHSPAGITSSLVIADNARITSLLLSLRIEHSFPPDLRIALISPAGTPHPINPAITDQDDFGIIIDHRVISAFNGQRAAGAWTLGVRDVAAEDIGRLDTWSLTVVSGCAAAAPSSTAAATDLR